MFASIKPVLFFCFVSFTASRPPRPPPPRPPPPAPPPPPPPPPGTSL